MPSAVAEYKKIRSCDRVVRGSPISNKANIGKRIQYVLAIECTQYNRMISGLADFGLTDFSNPQIRNSKIR